MEFNLLVFHCNTNRNDFIATLLVQVLEMITDAKTDIEKHKNAVAAARKHIAPRSN